MRIQSFLIAAVLFIAGPVFALSPGAKESVVLNFRVLNEENMQMISPGGLFFMQNGQVVPANAIDFDQVYCNQEGVNYQLAGQVNLRFENSATDHNYRAYLETTLENGDSTRFACARNSAPILVDDVRKALAGTVDLQESR